MRAHLEFCAKADSVHLSHGNVADGAKLNGIVSWRLTEDVNSHRPERTGRVAGLVQY